VIPSYSEASQMTQGLSETERRVYDAAIALIRESEFGPTFLEIAQRAGVSEAWVNKIVRHLVELGLLTFNPKIRRSLRKGIPLSKLKQESA
jgi:DNA-binding Lrp family transcriptional regulator